MRILVLTDRFLPEITAPSFRIRDHAREWIRAGHEVSVVTCAPNFPAGRVFPGYRNALVQEETLDGVRVVRLWSYMTANEGIVLRSLDHFSFSMAACLLASRIPRFDVLLATSPPLFVALGGWILSKLKKKPWVFEVRDLWPASIRAVGASDTRLLSLLEMMELALYRRSNGIIALTNGIAADIVARGIPPDKVSVVTNGVDADLFQRRGRAREKIRGELGVGSSEFLAGYIGTLGMAHGVETLVEAFARFGNGSGIRLLLLGEGAERQSLLARARSEGITNVIFHDPVPNALVPDYLEALDASIVHLKPHPLFAGAMPSKVFESMAMEVPLLLALEGECAEMVRAAGCGVCVQPGSPGEIADALVAMAQDRPGLQRMGRAGREWVRRHYTRTACAEKAIAVLERAGKRGAEFADISGQIV